MDNEKQKTAELIRQIQNGNKSAFDEFYKLTSPKAYFTALKITQNEHDAEDILQESYIKALEKINEIDPSQNVTAWFFKIVSNKSKDLLKGRKALIFENEEETVFEDITEDSTEFIPEENLNQEELRLEVMAAIDELTAEKRACIMMMYFGEMSVKEIAESIEVPESTVKNRLYTARKDLKHKFEKSGSVLYGAAIGGLIIWALNKTSVTVSAAFAASAASAEILAGIGASAAYSAVTGASASAVAVTTATAATSTTATTAAATETGIAAKVAALSVIQKVAVGIAATTVIGGSTAGVVTVVKTVADKPEPTTLAEEVTTAVVKTTEYVFNEIILPEETTENSSLYTSETTSERVSSNASITSATKATTTAPHTTAVTEPSTQRTTTTRPETTTEKETTTQTATTTRPVTTVPTTVTATAQTTATVYVDIIDLNGSVIDTLSFIMPAGTTLSRETIIDLVRAKNYEPMAGVYGDDIGTVAQGGQTYHFEAEL